MPQPAPKADFAVRRDRAYGVRPILLACLCIQLAACSWLDERADHPVAAPPMAWQADAPSSAPPVHAWIDGFDDERLSALAMRTEKNNHELAAQRAVVAQAAASLRATGAARWPDLQLAVDTAERRTGVDFARSASSASAVLQASFAIDIWGRLSDLERGALMVYEQQRAQYAALRIDILAGVARDWYTLTEADQLVRLLEERLANLRQNLDVIEDGYRLGLSESLDVYLARNQLEQESANLQTQRQQRDDARRTLELSLGGYPAATLTAGETLPVIERDIATGIPASLVERRPDIQAAWLALLNADSQVAAARKARFPQITLSADVGRSALELIKLASDSTLVWSLAAGLTQPLFDGGRLAAEESRARATVVELEQRYLRTVFLAFAEVEQAVSLTHTLVSRLEAVERARTNAVAAEELAFDQYRRGIVAYATVLEAQRRAFDAETEVVTLRAALLRNRVDLHAALGASPLGA